MSNTKLFVGNLSYNTTENDLQDAFAAHGTVVEANLMVDRMSGRPRGFAFVTMGTPEEAQKAIEALSGLPFKASMAFCASSGVPMVTKAKPRGRPLMRSTMRLASTTVPWAANASWRSFSVVLYERFP